MAPFAGLEAKALCSKGEQGLPRPSAEKHQENPRLEYTRRIMGTSPIDMSPLVPTVERRAILRQSQAFHGADLPCQGPQGDFNSQPHRSSQPHATVPPRTGTGSPSDGCYTGRVIAGTRLFRSGQKITLERTPSPDNSWPGVPHDVNRHTPLPFNAPPPDSKTRPAVHDRSGLQPSGGRRRRVRRRGKHIPRQQALPE